MLPNLHILFKSDKSFTDYLHYLTLLDVLEAEAEPYGY